MKNYEHVLSPIRIGNHLIKNRVITGPTAIHSGTNGESFPTEEIMRTFEDRAKAGAGIVTVTGVATGPAGCDGKYSSWDIYKPVHLNSLAQLTDRIHFYGAKASMELQGIFPDGYAVSDGAICFGQPGREIPIEKMMEFKQWYVDAALAMKACGFDGILFHFGHSMPIAQFLSPYTNKRTDEYGGNTENRCRYLNEVLTAVRKEVGSSMFFDVRISGSEFQEGGINLEEGIRIAELLQDNIDILQVSAGMHNPTWMTWTHPCGHRPPMPNVYLAEAFKKSGRIHVPITTIGAIPNLDEAENIIAVGKADFVCIARAFIADLDMMDKCKAGRTDDVVPCVKCMRCHDSTVYGLHMSCTVNPTIGLRHQLDHMIKPVTSKKRVAIIGGGPAGMRAAMTAAERGHDVTLYEKTDSLGGRLKFAKYVSFKYPLANYMEWLIQHVNKLNIKVLLNTEATPDMINGFDAVFVGIGADPIVPPISGVEKAHSVTEIFGNGPKLGKKLVFIGGGLVALESCLHFAELGHDITVLEMQNALAPDASTTNRDEVLAELDKEKEHIKIVLNGRCTGVTDDGVTFINQNGQSCMLEADDVILAAGFRAKAAAADRFMYCADIFAEMGDCIKARTVEFATKEAWYAAINL